MKKIYKVVSRVIEGWSLARAIYAYEDPLELTRYVKGYGGYIRLDPITRDSETLKRYSNMRSLIFKYVNRIRRREKSIFRRISIINSLTVAIISAIIPALIFIKKVSLYTQVSIQDILVLREIPGLRTVTFTYGLLQTILITLILKSNRLDKRGIIRSILLHIIIYIIIFNIFTSVFQTLLM